MASDKVRLMGTVLPGFEGVAASELRSKVPLARKVVEERGKVHFQGVRDFESLLALRGFDNLYARLWVGEMGPHKVDLPTLRDALSHLHGTDVIYQFHEGLHKHPSIFVNASRSGKHTYSRFDLAEMAMEGLLKCRPRWRRGTDTEHDLEFRLDLVGSTVTLYVRLTDHLFRFRGDSRAFTQAALRPTVAHALVWMLGTEPGETFLDPFCGSGSIVAERAVYPFGRLLAGDISGEAVAAARTNAGERPGLTVSQWDARNLPVPDSSVDSVITNLPFGKQILEPGEIASLYTAFIPELVRVMKSGARGLLLTDQDEPLLEAAATAGLPIEKVVQLSLKGLHPWVFRIRKD